MRSLRSRLNRIERQSQRDDAENRAHDNMLTHRICALKAAREPGLALVRPEHTDGDTYRHIQETLAWARGDFREAERLADLNPNKHVPPPPGTPWEEQMRLAREALDATFHQAGDETERVRAAVRAATGAHA
ncbi:MAG: hypothetical protein KF838_03695 [Phycisphaeraceae bacterium]|nr:MAG: hypothetical protein KF838_03695 [Phycisphaeraceae bacterium]